MILQKLALRHKLFGKASLPKIRVFRCEERSGGVWVATSAALASSDINVLKVFGFVSTAVLRITAPVKAKSCSAFPDSRKLPRSF